MANEQVSAGGKTFNVDIEALYYRINRIIEEMQHAQSANVTMTIEADKLRVEKYIKDLQTQIDTYSKLGIPDNPKTIPEQINLLDGPPVVNLENDDYDAVVKNFFVLRDELVLGQSSRLGGGLLPPDYKRSNDQLARIKVLFEQFIPATNPGDFPESTPNAPMVGPGRTGV